MTDSDLAAIPGLLPKYVAALADKCQITTPSALAHADRRTIYAALRRLKPHPELEDIAEWQDHARDLSRNVGSDPGWHPVAQFVVSFEQRGRGESPTRRLVAEQAEHGTPVPRAEWPSWGCDAICEWMHDQFIGDADTATAPAPAVASEPEPTEATEERRKPHPARRRKIRVDRIALIDADGTTTDLDLAAGEAARVECSPGSRVKVTVGGLPASSDVNVALRLNRPGQPGVTPHPPTTARPGTPVQIDLSELREGSHSTVLVAWTSRGTAASCTVALPTISVRAATP